MTASVPVDEDENNRHLPVAILKLNALHSFNVLQLNAHSSAEAALP